MAAIFRCPRYPTIRVNRGDGTYMEFVNGVFCAESVEDIALLRQDITGHVIEDEATRGLAVTPAIAAPNPLPSNIVTWYSPMLGVADGYGSSAEHMIRGLERHAGMSVRVQPGYALSGPTYLKDVLDRPFERGAVKIAYSPPSKTWHRQSPNQAALAFSMWEDDVLPDAFNDPLRQVDAVAAPSLFTCKLFEQRITDLGLDVPVCYVPLAIDASLFPFRKRSFQRDNETFVVLHSSTNGGERRKGADVAYRAFCKAFGDQTDVRLVLRSRFAHIAEVNGDPRVTVLEGVIDDERKVEIFHGAHALLYPSRGEGFGLIPLEAIATGLPAIVADNTSMVDYRDLYHPIACSPAPSGLVAPWCPKSTGRWAEPDVDVAAAQLRALYENYPRAANAAARAAKQVRKVWTYERTTRALVDAIEVARARWSASRVPRVVPDAREPQG